MTSYYFTKHFLYPLKVPLHVSPLKFLLFDATISTVAQQSKPHPIYRKTFSNIFQECSKQRALEPGQQAHARMVVSGFQTTIFVTNCLIQMYIQCSHLECANKVFDKMSERDTVSWNVMIFGYSMNEKMRLAQSCFDLMPERDVISWNSLISGYMGNGDCLQSVKVFLLMGRDGVDYDETTFAVVLKACSSLEDFSLGTQVHGIVDKLGFLCNVVTGSAILDMYAKCKRLDESLQFFYEMPFRNWVSWSAVIAGCAQNDELACGLKLFIEMQRNGVGVSQSIYASAFRISAGLSTLPLGCQLHTHALKTDFGDDIVVGTSMLDMYAKCDNLHDARKVFNLLPNRNLQSHNALIVGYARGGNGFEGLQLFQLLLQSGLGFDEISLSGAFSAASMVIKGCFTGIQVHGLAIKSPFKSNVCVENAMLDMYGKCGALMEAWQIFDEMEGRDEVSWNAIIAAYGQNQNEEDNILLFARMLQSRIEPDEFTYGSVLKACADRQSWCSGREVHGRAIKSGMGFDSFVGSALVDMYSKCGMMDEAEKLHNRLEEQTLVSWNSIISGFSSEEDSEGAQNFFARLLEMGVKPDNFTYATVLDTCANVANIGLGKQLHAQIIKQDLLSDVYITSTLVDMYSKCGNLQDSVLMFAKSSKRDFVTWNAMVCAYAHHGLAEEALQIFEKMQLEKVIPHHSTFVAVLRACAHIGLVENALHYFNLMQTVYGLEPQLEHFSSMVEILGKSGRLVEALRLIQDMPFEADDVIWRTLLSICKIRGNVEVAEKAASSLLKLDPEDSSAYVLLSNIYADAEMWDEVSKMRKVMRHSRLKKEPGCSWIQVQSELHMFLVGDKAHPRSEEIYENLDMLIDEMKRDGYGTCSQVIQYIQFLQEKLQMYEGAYQGWSPEPTKLAPWKINSGPVESFLDQTQLERHISGHEDNGVLNPLRHIRNSVESELIGSSLYKSTDNLPTATNQPLLLNLPTQAATFEGVSGQSHQECFPDAEQVTQLSQSHSWQGRSCVNDYSIPICNTNESEQKSENGEASHSSTCSQLILSSLKNALQSSGVDLSQASISVQLDVGKQINDRSTMAKFKMKDNQSTPGLASVAPGNEHPHKRFRVDES